MKEEKNTRTKCKEKKNQEGNIGSKHGMRKSKYIESKILMKKESCI